MWKRILWLCCVFVMLCSCIALVYAGTVFVINRAIPVVTINPPQTPTDALKDQNGFPMMIDGTTLIAASLAMYEGDMLEDDSDEFLVDAAALEIYNYGNREVELAEVTLEFETKKMQFFGTNIPAGGKVLIIEQDANPWTEQACVACTGWVQYSEDMPLLDTQLHIEEIDMGQIRVRNLTGKQMEDVWLFYKNYLHEARLYIGGITYIEVIPSIAPGEQVLLDPERYVSGYSKIVKAKQVG